MINWDEAPEKATGAVRVPSSNAWHWIMPDNEGKAALGEWFADGNDEQPLVVSRPEGPLDGAVSVTITMPPPVRDVMMHGVIVRG